MHSAANSEKLVFGHVPCGCCWCVASSAPLGFLADDSLPSQFVARNERMEWIELYGAFSVHEGTAHSSHQLLIRNSVIASFFSFFRFQFSAKRSVWRDTKTENNKTKMANSTARRLLCLSHRVLFSPFTVCCHRHGKRLLLMNLNTTAMSMTMRQKRKNAIRIKILKLLAAELHRLKAFRMGLTANCKRRSTCQPVLFSPILSMSRCSTESFCFFASFFPALNSVVTPIQTPLSFLSYPFSAKCTPNNNYIWECGVCAEPIPSARFFSFFVRLPFSSLIRNWQ